MASGLNNHMLQFVLFKPKRIMVIHWFDTLWLWWDEIQANPSTLNYMFDGLNFTQFVRILRGHSHVRRDRRRDCLDLDGIKYYCVMQCKPQSQWIYIDEFFVTLSHIWLDMRCVIEVASLERFIIQIAKHCGSCKNLQK